MSKTHKAAFLIRMSSEHQKDSPKRQRENVSIAIQREHIEIVKEYADEGISGVKTSKRLGLKQMLKDAEKGMFDVVVVDTIDRLSRLDSIDVGEIIKPLRKAGVKLFSAKEGWCDWSQFADRIKFFLHSELGNQWLSGHAYKALSGRVAKIKAGTHPPRASYGYDRVVFDESGEEMKRVRWDEKFTKPRDWTCKLEPTQDAEVVETIRWIFSLYAQPGITQAEVIRRLNERKIPTPLGKSKWGLHTLKNILTNTAYIGSQRYGLQRAGVFFQLNDDGEIIEGSGDPEAAPREVGKPAFELLNMHPAIIEKGLFDKVQAKVEETKERTGGRSARNPNYSLTGILKCGSCGRNMVGACTRHKKKRDLIYRRYMCSGSVYGECVQYGLRAEELESTMMEYAIDHLATEIDSVQKSVKRQLASRKRTNPKNNAAKIQREIDNLGAKIEKGSQNILLADSEDIPKLTGILAEWRAHQKELRDRLAIVETQDAPADEKAIVGELRALQDGFRDADPGCVRELFLRVFDHIDIYWDHDAPRGRKLMKGHAFFA